MWLVSNTRRCFPKSESPRKRLRTWARLIKPLIRYPVTLGCLGRQLLSDCLRLCSFFLPLLAGRLGNMWGCYLRRKRAAIPIRYRQRKIRPLSIRYSNRIRKVLPHIQTLYRLTTPHRLTFKSCRSFLSSLVLCYWFPVCAARRSNYLPCLQAMPKRLCRGSF